MSQPREYAEATAAQMDASVRALLEEAHRQALEELRRHRVGLDLLADELMTHETVDGERLDEILSGGDEARAA